MSYDTETSKGFIKLTAGNYVTWEPRAKGDLQYKGVWRIVNGTDTCPSEPPPLSQPSTPAERAEHRALLKERALWLTNDDIASGTIMRSIDTGQEDHILGHTSSKEAWDLLKTAHAGTNTGIAAFYIKVRLLQTKFVEGSSLQTHISTMALDNKRLATYKKAFDDEFFAQLLLVSLPPSTTWQALTVVLLQSSTDSNPLASKDVIARLLQEETRLSGLTDQAEAQALLVKAARSHTRSAGGKGKPRRCHYCDFTGHIEAECRKKLRDEESKKGKGSATAARAEGPSDPDSSSVDSDSSSDTPAPAPRKSKKTHTAHAAIVAPSDDEYEEGAEHVFVAANLAKESIHDSNIDSGASRHLSPCFEWFDPTTYEKLETPIAIHLGDASIIKAVGKGTLRYALETKDGLISGKFPNVLHVPKLATTLLSVSQLTKTGHRLVFDDIYCDIVVKTSGKIVGRAVTSSSGLYRLLGRPTVIRDSPLIAANIAAFGASAKTIDVNLLHQRLGHLGF